MPSLKHWHHDPISTYHFNAMSLLTPLLEAMVIGCIRGVQRSIQDPKLLLDTQVLLKEEASHANGFVRFNLKYIAPFYGKSLLKLRFGVWRAMVQYLPKSYRLGACAFGEHLATVSSEVLLQPRWFHGLPEDIRSLWDQHSIEEIRHKAVAFDVWNHFCQSYVTRVISMSLFLTLFLFHYFELIHKMIKTDKRSYLTSYYLLFKFQWGRGGLFRQLFFPLLSYLKRQFHPNQRVFCFVEASDL